MDTGFGVNCFFTFTKYEVIFILCTIYRLIVIILRFYYFFYEYLFDFFVNFKSPSECVMKNVPLVLISYFFCCFTFT